MTLGAQRGYNVIHVWKRFVCQIMLQKQCDGVIIDLLPCITVAFGNSDSYLAVGFSWIAGRVNLAIARQHYLNRERNRRAIIATNAAERGLTPRQMALRWGW